MNMRIEIKEDIKWSQNPYNNYLGKIDNQNLFKLPEYLPKYFGEFVGDGAESLVFLSSVNKNEVLKVHYATRSYEGVSRLAMENSIKNEISIFQPIQALGFIKCEDSIVPVSRQEAAEEILQGVSKELWDFIYFPLIQRKLAQDGFKDFVKGNVEICDIRPDNVGIIHGEVKIIDAALVQSETPIKVKSILNRDAKLFLGVIMNGIDRMSKIRKVI